jgi:hypothetical protein
MTSNRWLLTCAAGAAWVLTMAGTSGAARPAAPAPRVVLERTAYDAGTVTPGDVIRVDFPFRNAGNAPLAILDVKKDCGCLVPRYDEEIAPGATGRVRVALQTQGFQGPIEKHVYVETDDPSAPSVALTIKAVLPRAVEVTPTSELLIPITRGQDATVDVTLRSTDGHPLELGAAESPVPYVTATIVPDSPSTGPEVRLRITVAADAPSQTFETLITVGTGHYRLPKIGLKVFGQPAASVTVRPPRLAFGRVRPAEKGPIERILTLTRSRGSFRVLKLEDSLGCLKLESLPADDGSAYEIKIRYLGGWKDEQTQGVLRITTDDPSRPTIEIPYTAEVW